MIVVDTSVWIDVLNDTANPQASECVDLIEADEPVALTDVIVTEVCCKGSARSARRRSSSDISGRSRSCASRRSTA